MLENNLEEITEQARDVNINERLSFPFLAVFLRQIESIFLRVSVDVEKHWKKKRKSCRNTRLRLVLPQNSSVSRTSTHVSRTRQKHHSVSFLIIPLRALNRKNKTELTQGER